MRVHLLQPEGDFDWTEPPPYNAAALLTDLDLAPVLDSMGGGEPHLRQVAERVLLAGTSDVTTIGHRQGVLMDCLAHPTPVREMYRFAHETLEGERRQRRFGIMDSAEATISRAVASIDFLTHRLAELRRLAERMLTDFVSPGWRTLLSTLIADLDDEYLAEVRGQLRHLNRRNGILVSDDLGHGNRGVRHVLHPLAPSTWWRRLLEHFAPVTAHTVVIADRDEAGARALGDLTDRCLRPVAEVLAHSCEEILAFFTALYAEVAFYLAATNLHRALSDLAVDVSFPTVLPVDVSRLAAHRLRDTALALRIRRTPVPSDMDADPCRLVVITGANQGGKSTFLRSVGQAALMTRAGMFVSAAQFELPVPAGLTTHFNRQEDRTMSGGKLEEDLRRIAGDLGHLRPGAWLLMNEPFAATNARDGSEIGWQICQALLERSVRMMIVTHMYELAERLRAAHTDDAVFLRALPEQQATDPFRIVPGVPEPAGNGVELFERRFPPDSTSSADPAVPLGPPTKSAQKV